MRKPATIFGVTKLENFTIPVSESEKVLILDNGMVKECSPDV